MTVLFKGPFMAICCCSYFVEDKKISQFHGANPNVYVCDTSVCLDSKSCVMMNLKCMIWIFRMSIEPCENSSKFFKYVVNFSFRVSMNRSLVLCIWQYCGKRRQSPVGKQKSRVLPCTHRGDLAGVILAGVFYPRTSTVGCNWTVVDQ